MSKEELTKVYKTKLNVEISLNNNLFNREKYAAKKSIKNELMKYDLRTNENYILFSPEQIREIQQLLKDINYIEKKLNFIQAVIFNDI